MKCAARQCTGNKNENTTEVKAMRNSTRFLTLMLLLSASLASTPAVQAEELSRAALLSASCEGCHGTGGRSPGAIPAIAGKSADYLREALESFRAGEREATVMGRHATGYSDEEIRQIAEYFSKQ
jgi:sulfide dehydrogenase cytochrome subunit